MTSYRETAGTPKRWQARGGSLRQPGYLSIGFFIRSGDCQALCQVLSPTDPLPFPALTCPVGVALLFVIGSRSGAVYTMVSGKPGASIFQSLSHRRVDFMGQARAAP